MAAKAMTQRESDPRTVGGHYWDGYWSKSYEVLAIEFDSRGWLVSVTVRDADGTRTHGTAWDRLRDKVMSAPGHVADVVCVPNNHGYPYRAVCTCGWQSPTYVAKHAAAGMAADHVS